jgi:hypothetical protein
VTRATKILAAPLAAGLALLLAGAAFAVVMPTEYELKAAYLYNFAKFVEWPDWTFDQTGGAMVMGVLGGDPFGPALERLAAAQQVQGRRIAIKRGRSVGEMGFCHVLFIAAPQPDIGWDQTIRSASGPSRLLVGDGEHFAELGGGIGFFFEERRIRFVINVAATDRARLKVSSKVLALAKLIRR